MPIPNNELHITFVRSSGPGGQNVNKTSSKAQVRWNVSASRGYTEEEKRLIARALVSYLSAKGDIVMSSDETRSQSQNKTLVVNRLNKRVAAAIIPAAERIKTKPTKSSRRKRIEKKIKHSQKKRIRRLIDLFFF